jgi:RHS repeat-associated protein
MEGIDYAYTLQGWLKGVNGNSLNPENEMGRDGKDEPATSPTKDAYAYSLGYYKGDYKPIGGTGFKAFGMQFEPKVIPTGATTANDYIGQNLYNGNISNTTVALSKLTNTEPVGYTYRYDQLNRLKEMRQHALTGSSSTNTGTTVWDATSNPELDAYKESFSYDANGNIETLKRNGQNAVPNVWDMDNLAYNYEKYPLTDKKVNNKLLQVNDGVAGKPYIDDIENQALSENYQYDEIGNLTHDDKENLDKIEWTVYGKIQSITKTDGSQILYTYDPYGNRVSKLVTPPSGGQGATSYYVRDAQGNNLGLYEKKATKILWKEQGLYGSSRLGLFRPEVEIGTNINKDLASKLWSDRVGYQNYELTNHLGNVMAVISDKRTLTNGVYEPEVVSVQDYYSFGSPMPGRTYSISGTAGYRYGFNGKENDNEVKGVVGSQQDYGMRIFDPRLGRFLSEDPIANQYPWNSTYAFAENRPIDGIDLDGLEFRRSPGLFFATGRTYVPKLKKATNEMNLNLRYNSLPDYYKSLNIKDISNLASAAQSTQFKLKQFNVPEEGTSKSAKQANESAIGIALSSYVENTLEVKSYSEVSEQVNQFTMAIGLIHSATDQRLIPDQFKENVKFQADLLNYLFDGSLIQGDSKSTKAYNKVVSMLGNEIYNNRFEIYSQRYSRKPTSILVEKPKFGLDYSSPVGPFVKRNYGEDKLKKAIEDLNCKLPLFSCQSKVEFSI